MWSESLKSGIRFQCTYEQNDRKFDAMAEVV